MTLFYEALIEHRFLQYALAAGLLASVGCGVIGTCVVVKRISFLAGSIAHAVLGGLGVAHFFGLSAYGGALVAALAAAMAVGWLHLRRGEDEDVLIAAVWSVGMAVGVVFIARTPGYVTDLTGYLFGNILLVEPRALMFMAVLDVVVIVLVALFYRPLLAVMLDEELARLRGVPTTAVYLLLLAMVALAIVLLLPVVGLLLVLALLTLPAAIARRFARTLAGIMALATLLGFAFTSMGLAASYAPDLPPGATVVLIAGLAYILTLLGTGAIARWRSQHAARAAQAP